MEIIVAILLALQATGYAGSHFGNASFVGFYFFGSKAELAFVASGESGRGDGKQGERNYERLHGGVLSRKRTTRRRPIYHS
jgi:hypothetical protein